MSALDLLTYLSMSPPDMFAGFLGGIVNCFVFRRTGPKAVLGALSVGMLTANYMSIPVNNALYSIHPHGGAFLVGALGVAGIQWMLGSIKDKLVSERKVVDDNG